MLNDIVTWIENHEITVGLLRDAVLVFFAWLSGAFVYFRRFRDEPHLRIVETASFVIVERVPATAERPEAMRTSFILNVSLVNSSNEKVVLDHFELSYQAHSFLRSYRQRLLRIAFPSRPRKRVGEGVKYMGVWFTEYPQDDLKMDVIDGKLESKDQCSGFLLFTSYTYGSWNPWITDGEIRIRLNASLTSRQRLSTKAKVRVSEDMQFADDFSPGLGAHVAHASTWNHDLSVARK